MPLNGLLRIFAPPPPPPPPPETASLTFLTSDSALLLVILLGFCLFTLRRSLPPVQCSFWEVLRNYKPGHIYHLHERYARKAKLGGRCWTIKIPTDPRIFGTIDPCIVEHVLRYPTPMSSSSKPVAVYEKGPQWRTAFQDLLGNGIFNADGDTWRGQRKIASHEFSIRSLKTFLGDVFCNHLHSVLRIVRASADAGEVIDVQALFSRYTLDAIGHIGFGVDVGCLENGAIAAAFADAFDTATRLSGGRFVDPLWKVKRWVNCGTEAQLRRALRYVHEFTDKVITERRTVSAGDLSSRGDLLSRFMLKDYSDEQLRDTIINFVLAGRDTTAILLTWTVFELAQHPEVVVKLRAEAEALARAGTTAAAAAAVAESQTVPAPLRALLDPKGGSSPYLKATLTEVLRLHPSVPLDFKTALRDDQLPDGTQIKAGERVMFVTYAMGRDPQLWADPLRFDPSRHLGAEGEFVFPPSFKFPVFLAGPRTCLGKDMAYLGAGLLLTQLLSHFDLELMDDPSQITYDIGLTLWTPHGLRVRFRERVIPASTY